MEHVGVRLDGFSGRCETVAVRDERSNGSGDILEVSKLRDNQRKDRSADQGYEGDKVEGTHCGLRDHTTEQVSGTYEGCGGDTGLTRC